MNATLNTFPPFQSMNSPRGWILAAIVLLHCGFFYLLSSGMAVQIIEKLRPPSVLVIPTPEREQLPQPVKQTIVNIDPVSLTVPPPDPIPSLPQEPNPETAPAAIIAPPPSAVGTETPGPAAPVITAPDIDPRLGLSEPPYPASEIRAEHTGTVLLSIYVLENGRVGEVRLDQSSGYPKLDDSALREARRWKLRPGMRDGVPVAMWKQIPVTFQLQGAGSRRF
jgi:protein TonB